MSSSASALTDRLHEVARSHGVAGFGIGAADPFPDVAASMAAHIGVGRHGALRFTFRDPATATDIRQSFPWAERLAVAAWSYLPEAGHPGPGRPATGRIARFATEDHYRGLRLALDAVAAELETSGYRHAVLVDDSRLVDRAAAVRAGVGWWGKNTMVLAPGAGPWLLLGSVATDAPLVSSKPMRRDCGTCTACLPACPTGALVEPGILDARLCLAHWLQTPGVIPRELRRAVGDRIYGCDDCLDACPPGHRLMDRTDIRRGRVDLVELLSSDDATLLARFGHFYIPRRQPRFLRRNALVAAANGGGTAAREVLARYAIHDDWLLRLHAVWGLGEIGAHDLLAARQALEAHEAVAAEIEHALGGGET